VSSASRTFACRPTAVRDARELVRTTLDGRPAEVIDAAELMISELASNCVRHAQTEFEVRICAKDEVRIEVRDRGEGSPRVLSPGVREPSGRGLRIVEAMSRRWGVIPEATGKVVWFTIS
jgi:anti-sigma regulatory factor (Ser/Thr protein kinase)